MIWCPYLMNGRSFMSQTITAETPRTMRRTVSGQRRRIAPALRAPRPQLAEDGYVAELLHADRRRPAPARADALPVAAQGTTPEPAR
jgi:hypothetical protein